MIILEGWCLWWREVGNGPIKARGDEAAINNVVGIQDDWKVAGNGDDWIGRWNSKAKRHGVARVAGCWVGKVAMVGLVGKDVCRDILKFNYTDTDTNMT